MAERECPICRQLIGRGQGEPCVRCGEWFHFNAKKYPAAPACGVASDRIPGLVA